jgi:hypothetical protein
MYAALAFGLTKTIETMKLKFNITLAITVLLGMLVSCFDPPGTDIVLDNVAIIEINEATTPAGTNVVKTYNRLTDGRRLRDSIQVNLIGRAKDVPITINFNVEGVPPSAAQPGFHFAMITQGSVTIPAGRNIAFIYHEVIDDNINPGEVWRFRITLTGSDQGTSLDPNRSVFTRGLRVLCPFNRDNFTGPYLANEPGYGTYNVSFAADPGDPNAIIISNFWDFGGTVRYVFNPSAATISIPSQSVVMGNVTYTVDSPTAGTYDPCTFSMVVPYRVRQGATTVDSNVHTFTRR